MRTLFHINILFLIWSKDILTPQLFLQLLYLHFANFYFAYLSIYHLLLYHHISLMAHITLTLIDKTPHCMRFYVGNWQEMISVSDEITRERKRERERTWNQIKSYDLFVLRCRFFPCRFRFRFRFSIYLYISLLSFRIYFVATHNFRCKNLSFPGVIDPNKSGTR